MNTLTVFSYNIVADNVPNVSPKYDAPWNNFLQDMGGKITGSILIALIVALVVAALVFAIGKIGSNHRAQEGGAASMAWIVVAVVIVASAAGAVSWFAGFELF